MTFLDTIRIFLRNWKLLIFFPLMVGITVFLFTIGAQKEYMTNAVIYTGIASGYDITAEDEPKTDFFQVNNAFDNLISTVNSRETMEETAMRLLAHDLMIRKPGKLISEYNFEKLHEQVPAELSRQLVRPTLEETFLAIQQHKTANNKNLIIDIIDATSGNYAINQIRNNLKASRKNTSDMLELVYVANDPAMAKNTLDILIEVFIRRYKRVKNKEANDVVEWYEERLKIAVNALESAENAVKDFSTQNKLINYYEQTKFLAEAHLETEAEKEKTKQRIAGANSELGQLEKQIDTKQQIYKLNQDLSELRKELAVLQYRVTNGSVLNSDDPKLPEQKKKIKEMESQIQAKVQELHMYENNPSGLSRDNILREWLNNDLTSKGSNSELDVINTRLSSIDQKYSEYAPLGAKLATLERQVMITEKEYLSYLHGLNMAKLRQQNIELANSLSTLDDPFYPLKAQPSKRALVLLLSMIAAFVLAFGTMITLHLLDNSIKSVSNAKKLTGREVIGVIPDFETLDKDINPHELRDYLFTQLNGAFSLEYIKQNVQEQRPKFMHLCSFRENEGKKWIGYEFAQFLSEKGMSVALFFPNLNLHGKTQPIGGKVDIFYYEMDNNFVYQKSIIDRAHKPFTAEKYDYVITCFPNISEYQIPVETLKNGDIMLCILDATRIWTPSDNNLNYILGKLSPIEPLIMLNKVTLDNLETIYGDIPKKRNAFRSFVKARLNKLIS